MKFKRTFNILIDNFSVTFKLLLYRLGVFIIFAAINIAILAPYFNSIFDYANLNELFHEIGSFFSILFQGNSQELINLSEQLIQTWNDIQAYVSLNEGHTILILVAVIVLALVKRFIGSIGNYTATALVNDNMALQAKSPFFPTLIKNLGHASLYGVIYVPISTVYDAAFFTLGFYIFFVWLSFVPFPFAMFLPLMFTVYALLVVATKMTFTSDWLPSLVVGKKSCGQAMKYTFNYKGKRFANVFSNFIIFVLIILAANMASVYLTFGAGLLLTIPASYVILICFELVNYCDHNNLKYFIDRDTIVKPAKEKVRSREDFFKGE